MTLACIGRPHPIAEAACLCATPTNVGERQPTNENVIALAKNEECIGKVAALIL